VSAGAELLLPLALAAVAFLYASVGHAGASGYIAVLALFGWSALLIKPLALLLNTLVAALGCWAFLRAGHWPGRAFWPVYVLALPAAFWGGTLHLPVLWLQRILGLVLLASAWRLGCQLQEPLNRCPPSAPMLALAGGSLGLLAGLTGTGGGVFLSPLLLLGRWCGTRQAAAVSVLFILLNSLAGLAGLWLTRPAVLMGVLQPQLLLWLALVLPAGALGARLGSRHWPLLRVRRCLAVVLVLAGSKLLISS
jgi:uncharacterized membrane protein YfcA